MHWVFTPLILPLLLSTAVSATLGLLLLQRPSTPGSRPFAFGMLAAAAWSFFYALEIGSPDLPVKIILSDLEYIGITAIPVCWLLFALDYAGVQGWQKPIRLFWIVIIPTLTLILFWTNPFHGLIWSQARLDTSGPFAIINKTYGPWFWLFTTYAYAVLLVGSYYLVYTVRHTSRWYSRQLLPLFVGILLPWLGNVLYLAGINPIPRLDLTPALFAVSGIVLIYGVFRFWLFDLVPFARTAVIDRMIDGVLIVDDQERVVDMNTAAAKYLDLPIANSIGQKAATALARYPQLWENFPVVEEQHEEFLINRGDEPSIFDLRISPLFGSDHQVTGQFILLHDITQPRQAEQELEKSHSLLLATLEAAADGLLVVNARGKIVRYNRKYAEMWRFPEEMLRRADDQEMMAFILDQLINPAGYYRLMNKLAVQPDAESYDVLELRDGRVLERYSRPQRIGDVRVGRVWSFHEITEQRKAEERLRFLSTHDILTGLYNRVYFEEELNRLEGSRQYPISLIIADVDGLKETNDRYGHLSGDALLRRAAEILRQACRSEDMVARIGGDEFGIVLPHSDTHVAENACQRIQNMLGMLKVGELEFPISLSLGVATARSGDPLRKVLRQADKAMYIVKRSKHHSNQNGPLPDTDDVEP